MCLLGEVLRVGIFEVWGKEGGIFWVCFENKE